MTQNIKPLQWSDALTTGVDIIDKQHKMLINILNDANLCFRGNSNSDTQKKIIDDLVSYTVYHFDTEEELIEKFALYDDSPDDEIAHIREHRSFAGRVKEYQAAVYAGKPINYETVFSYLNSWLVNHVMGTDQKLGKFLLSKHYSSKR